MTESLLRAKQFGVRSLDLPRDAGAVYRKRAGVGSRHHDDTMMRDENRVKK